MMKAVGTPCLQALLALANSNLQCYKLKEIIVTEKKNVTIKKN